MALAVAEAERGFAKVECPAFLVAGEAGRAGEDRGSRG